MKETDIMRLIQLKASEMGGRLLRNNIGAFKDKAGQWIRFGVGGLGGSDLMGWMSPNAKFTVVEVKVPGEEPTEDQYKFLDTINKAGGIGIWADSVDMFVSKIKKRL